MIRHGDRSAEFAEQLRGICNNSPYGARILAYYSAYSGEYSFLDFWIYSGEAGKCALCRIYDTMILCGEGSDEAADFVRVLSPRVIFGEAENVPRLPDRRYQSGETMLLKNTPDSIRLPSGYTVDVFGGEMKPLKMVYDLLRSSFDGGAQIGSFDEYFVDQSHLIRHSAARVYLVRREGQAAATLSVTSLGERDAVIGNIATSEKHRRRGLASYLVAAAALQLSDSGRNVWLHREKPVGIYDKLGFTTVGRWAQSSITDN